jgi:hypothetical protein
VAVRVIVEDESAFAAVRPLDIAAYLRSRGWVELGSGDEPASAWEKQVDRDTYEVLAPKHSGWRDYPRRVKSLVNTLGEVENRSQLAILHDIAAVFFDIVRLRSADNAMLDGTIFLEDAVHVASSGRGMMLSAACATIQPKRAYHSRKPMAATRYVDGLRMGQTEHSSYVITIMSQVSPALAPRQMALRFQPGEELPVGFVYEEPYERRVTATLGRALHKLRSAATRGASTGSLDAFEDAIEAGVSADLCESLGLIRECSHITTFEVSIGWAPCRPQSGHVPDKVMFTTDVLDVIREAGRQLRERSPVEDFDLVGPVVDLSRTLESLHGTATVLGSVDGQLRKVNVDLWGADWQLAHGALGKTPHVLLKCTGELLKNGNLFVLKNARNVSDTLP